MAWSVMSDVPNPIIVDAAGTAGSGYILKAYEPGTTTSTSIAIAAAGTSPQASITANSEGKWEVSGNEILPYIDRKHKWGIFANTADATANTPFYMGPFDNVLQTSEIDETDTTKPKSYLTLLAAVADAANLVIGQTIYLSERVSGGGGGAHWNVIATTTNNTYNIVDTPLNTAISLSLSLDTYNALQWGMGDGSTDDTAAFNLIVASNRKVYFPKATYKLNNIALTGLKKAVLVGDGRENTVFDFDQVTSGVAFRVWFDSTDGGSQQVTLEKIGFTDDNATSLVDTMFQFQSGLTGQSPSETSGFMWVRDCGIIKYNNTSGEGVKLTDVSHITFDNWQDEFELGSGTSLTLENTIDINTGVYNFNNCVFRSAVRSLRINATVQLIDTVNFFGGFMGQATSSDARESILIEGSLPVAALNFKGLHVESRDDTETAVVLVTGKWKSGSVEGMHFSCGTASKQTDTLFEIVGEADMRAINFDSNEVLRLQDKSAGGRVFHFENTVVTDIEEPLDLGSWFFNSTTPRLIEVDIAGTHDGSSNVAVLSDSTAAWTTSALVGMTLSNDTDGSTTTITANTATTITGVLSGGTDDDWDASDAYTISGGNEDTIFKSVHSFPTIENRGATGVDRLYELEDSATPSVQGANRFDITSTFSNTPITDFVNEYKGQLITIVNTAGGTITFTHGASTIRCKGAGDLSLTNNDSVQFLRSDTNHWIQVGEVIST